MYNCKEVEPDWEGKCEVCGQSPILPCTGMCGPCTFGEADTILGNWGAEVEEPCDECPNPEECKK
jgi:hypothetical protein